MFQEIPPNSSVALTNLEVIRPVSQPSVPSLGTYHPMKALSMAGVVSTEATGGPAHRGPGPGRGILRISPGHVKKDSSASAPTRKSPRFAHLATVHNDLSPQDEIQCVTRTLRAPGPLPSPTAASATAPSVPRNEESDGASAGLNQLMMEGPTADTYTGAGDPQPQTSSVAGESPPSSSDSDPGSPVRTPSKFTQMDYRPPTPPLESGSGSAGPSVPVGQAGLDEELETVQPRVLALRSESPSGTPGNSEHVHLASTVVSAPMAGQGELPPPYPAAEQPSGDGEASAPGSQSSPPVTAPTLAPAAATDEALGASSQAPPVSGPAANNLPLRIITTSRKGRGVAASRLIPSGEIIVRERPLIDERHDPMPGGKHRIREA